MNSEQELEDLREVTLKKLNELRQVVQLQSMNGNWDQSEYMHGMANGLIVALAIFENEVPKFLDKPEGGYLQGKPVKEEPSQFQQQVMDLGDMGENWKL